jgi:hypothetical protein
MKNEFLPYYISRAILSLIFPILIFGFTWKVLFFGSVIFVMFLLYLHSGWFTLDPDHPFFPLRRDDRGKQVQRKALIMAVIFGMAAYFLLSFLSSTYDLSMTSGSISLGIGVIAYFTSQFVLFTRT